MLPMFIFTNILTQIIRQIDVSNFHHSFSRRKKLLLFRNLHGIYWATLGFLNIEKTEKTNLITLVKSKNKNKMY